MAAVGQRGITTPATLMEQKVRRPISIWLTQIVLTLAAAFMTLYLGFVPLMYASEGKTMPLSVVLSYMIPFGLLMVLELLSVLLLAFRKSSGRWLAGISLVIQGSLFCIAFLTAMNDWRDILVSFLLISSLPLSLVLSLIFSKKVRRFFAPIPGNEAVSVPTPPPSFD